MNTHYEIRDYEIRIMKLTTAVMHCSIIEHSAIDSLVMKGEYR